MQRKHGAAQTLTRHKAEKIALILGGIGGRSQHGQGFASLVCVAGRGGNKAGIMPCGQFVSAEIQCCVEQHTKFDGPVAVGAGIGRAPLGIGSGKGGQHLAQKCAAQVGHMQGHAKGSAGFGQPCRCVRWAIGQKKAVQGQHAVARVAQHNQRAKAVHAAADSNGHGDGGVGRVHGQFSLAGRVRDSECVVIKL